MLWFCVLLGIGISERSAHAEVIVYPTEFNLEYFIQADKDVYQLGEIVHVYHSVTNPWDVSYTFRFKQAPGFFLRVKQDGNTVWERGAFKMVIWELTLLPDETIEQEYIWDMLDYSGNLVDPGEYELVSMAGRGYEDSSTFITIIPEPGILALLLTGIPLIVKKKF